MLEGVHFIDCSSLVWLSNSPRAAPRSSVAGELAVFLSIVM